MDITINQGSAGTTLVTGTYTGDGTASQGITGLGVAPKLVWIFQRDTISGGAVEVFFSSNTIVDDNVAGGAIDIKNDTFQPNRIISLDADGFTVDANGMDAHPNKLGQIYNFYVE